MRTLTEAEIAALFNDGKGISLLDGLVACWPLNEKPELVNLFGICCDPVSGYHLFENDDPQPTAIISAR